MNRLYTADILIAGGGAAGIAAAVGAAECGMKTLLVDQHGVLGGLATTAMVGTICGLYYRNPDTRRYAVQGFAQAFAEQLAVRSRTQPQCFAHDLHFLPYHPADFHTLATQTLEQAGVQVLLNSSIRTVTVQDASITAITLLNSDQIIEIKANAFVDCSGHAVLSTLAGLNTQQEQTYPSAAFVFQVTGLPALASRPLALHLIRWIKKGIYCKQLDSDCDRLSMVPGTDDNGSALWKLGLPTPSGSDAQIRTIYEPVARIRAETIVQYLNQADVSWQLLRITKMATQIGIRSGSKPIGLETLDSDHIVACRKPDHGVAIAAWPMEYWGKERQPQMTYFDPADHYEIPAGALVSKYLDNLFFAGRAFSATEQAMASARVIGTCLGTGYAAGMLAAYQLQTEDWRNGIEAVRHQQVIKESK